ncbi:MAG: hypothetical protein KY453_02445 [Gemmatimonadetes bacterium]|nr:hypothetical protein [Gemmatimonadota bacterium]
MSFSKKATMFAMTLVLPLAACDVDQTEQGDLPEVEVEDGNLPEYDVQGPEVDIREDTVTVPEVDVDVPPEEGEGGEPGGPY